MDGLHSSFYFQILLSLYQSFSDCTKSTNYNWYRRHFHVSQFCQFSSKTQEIILLCTFFQFYSVVSRNSKDHNSASFVVSFLFFFFLFFFFFFFLQLLGPVVWPRLGDPFVFQNSRGVCAAHFLGRVLRCAYTIWLYCQISISCTIPRWSLSTPPSHV